MADVAPLCAAPNSSCCKVYCTRTCPATASVLATQNPEAELSEPQRVRLLRVYEAFVVVQQRGITNLGLLLRGLPASCYHPQVCFLFGLLSPCLGPMPLPVSGSRASCCETLPIPTHARTHTQTHHNSQATMPCPGLLRLRRQGLVGSLCRLGSSAQARQGRGRAGRGRARARGGPAGPGGRHLGRQVMGQAFGPAGPGASSAGSWAGLAAALVALEWQTRRCYRCKGHCSHAARLVQWVACGGGAVHPREGW